MWSKPSSVPGWERGRQDSNRLAASPGLAPRRCHPGPPSLSSSESSSPGRECAQGRGGRGDDQKGWRGVSSPRSADSLPPPPPALASFSSGRSTRPLSSPSPQMQGAKYSDRRGREMENSRARGERLAVAKLAHRGWRSRGGGEGARGGGGRGAGSGQLEPSCSCQQARARDAQGLRRACAPGAGLPPAGTSAA